MTDRTASATLTQRPAATLATHETAACRACGARSLAPILDLGTTPLANALLEAHELDRPEPRFPLRLVLCPACSLVQITETVPPEQLFRNYLYFSSFSDTMVEHAGQLARRLIAERALGPQSLVVEAASNDGYLLQHYVAAGIPVLGIEPAQNIAKVALERQIPTVAEFFGRDLARRLAREGCSADVFHANNVLAHVADLNGFVAGIRAILKPAGIAVVEAPYVKEMIDRVEFDTIYHEHLCYFSLTALDGLFARHGMTIVDVERLEIHGGSLRIVAAPAGAMPRSPRVLELRADEDRWGAARPDAYREFTTRVENLRRDLRQLLADLKSQGKRLAVYGASAKGSTLLNTFGIGRDLLDFVADRSTAKQNRFTPGTHLPIVPPERLLEDQPDYVLLLTWNFRDEILAQQSEYRRRGGKFIIPIPRLEVV